ncbi:DUF6122 family protein [Tunicatimonas pelagia]|uniref:DUF6122 family protein n=1 Tax=Tunicatimonas pelagia TaxID=931531 RepID=UPI002667092F|nr:DUF6122 family protein [Tunicatimonas pelagia]WKN43398.1 DUF6122 family protein [Tunicatimonas pelagia]
MNNRAIEVFSRFKVMQLFIHYFLHLVFPAAIALMFFRKKWKQAYLWMLATMLVDLDHLLANPIFQPNRCSVGFHYLHTFYASVIYFVMLFFPYPLRIVGLGLLLHLLTDFIDCLFMFSQCPECQAAAPAYEWLKTVASWLGI